MVIFATKPCLSARCYCTPQSGFIRQLAIKRRNPGSQHFNKRPRKNTDGFEIILPTYAAGEYRYGKLLRPIRRRKPSEVTRTRFFVIASTCCYLNWVLALGSSGSSGQVCVDHLDKHSSSLHKTLRWRLKPTVEPSCKPKAWSNLSLICVY